MSHPNILLTGATGYVGGRLLHRLEADGLRVRCMARNPEHLIQKASRETEIVDGDVLNEPSLRQAMQGIDTAYYLIHSMGSSKDFEDRDRTSARIFGEVAREMGVKRIIYLGGLGDAGELSSHLRSRQEVGEMLRDSGVQTIEFRASIIIGSGSLSFELIRGLVRKLPVMITPSWVRTPAQPIAIEDVLHYLVAGLRYKGADSRVFEIGGADTVGYGDLMMEYARQRGLKRLLIPVPFLSLRLSSLWLGLITPVYARIGRKMIDSVRNETIVKDPAALEAFDIRPRGYREAIARALANEEREVAETRWSDAISSMGTKKSWGGVKMGSRIVDSRRVLVDAPAHLAFTPIRRIGGQVGWYYGTWLWKLRGFLDLIVGGVGLRRGRRDPEHLQIGDALDFWRVTDYERDRRLVLFAEMKVPGRAWLHFEVTPHQGGSEIRQTAIFDPAGLGGLAYWYTFFPIHRLVFSGMLRGLVNAIPNEAGARPGKSSPPPAIVGGRLATPAVKKG
ncbi:MAG TPA: SDR family oxidoreductase [Rhodothermales bacterium]|nr:SDR family oxidoreductase [Rhodothermales bacterium]